MAKARGPSKSQFFGVEPDNEIVKGAVSVSDHFYNHLSTKVSVGRSTEIEW